MPKHMKKAAPKKAAPKKAAPKKAAPKKAAPKKAAPKKAEKTTPPICLEGYKISKAGRCIKDKKYQTIVATIPMPPPPPPAPGMKAPVSKPKTVKQLIAQFEAKKKGRMAPMKLREGNTVTFGLKPAPPAPAPPMILL